MLSVAERAPIYRLFAMLLVREVDPALWKLLRDEPIVRFFDGGRAKYRAWTEQDATDQLFENLAEEFAMLFLVPGGVPPFASTWLEGDREKIGAGLSSFVGQALEAMGREAQPSEPWGRLPLDHLAWLFDLLVAATQNSPDARENERLSEHLESQLLGPWVARFGEALEARAESPLYEALGETFQALFREPRG